MRILGKTNKLVHPIGLGGIPIQRTTQAEVDQMIAHMINLGLNFIDTARGYSNSEQLIGHALKNMRNHFVIATKSMAQDYESMRQDIDLSLSALQTEYIDVYQCHNVKEGQDRSEAMVALQEAKAQGKIKHIGITSHAITVLEEALDNPIFETIQYAYNVIETQATDLFKKAKERNVGVIVMKPLAGGIIDRNDVALKFILSNDDISVVIPGMGSVSELLANALVTKGELTKEEIDYMIHLRNTIGKDFCRRCGYCLPCTVGIDIPMQFIVEGYAKRYKLSDWAKERYQSLSVKPDACIACGLCETKCPYQLSIIKKLKQVKETFKNGF